MNIKTQIIIQVGLWLLGMILNYWLTGSVIVGGFLGATVGFILVLLLKN